MNLLKSLQEVLGLGTVELKVKTLWTLYNIVCNSEKDAMAIVDSGLLSNVSLALRQPVISVRQEALWVFSGLFHKLDDPYTI